MSNSGSNWFEISDFTCSFNTHGHLNKIMMLPDRSFRMILYIWVYTRRPTSQYYIHNVILHHSFNNLLILLTFQKCNQRKMFRKHCLLPITETGSPTFQKRWISNIFQQFKYILNRAAALCEHGYGNLQ